MKYGLLVNEKNQNIGDDIQAYAEARFLPRVDVMVDREHLNTFKYGDGTEPVALIMGAWFMWRKYNWPPVKQIVPLNIGYHHYNRVENILNHTSPGYGLPIFEEHYSGCGGQWFKDHGPVGCRDLYTCEVFTRAGIPNYFSGCVTLTLPKQKKTKDKDKYIVLVDLNKEVEEKVRKLVGDKYEIRKITHETENIDGATWEERSKRVEEYLTIYQNAKYVVTRRLHVALPCLAMEVPVMVIQSVKMNDPNRFDPYKKWLHYCRNNDFLRDGYKDFDFENGTPNKPDYKQYRKSLTKTMEDFVKYCEDNKDKPIEFFNKPSYTEEELNKWKSEFYINALNSAHSEARELYKMVNKLKQETETLKKDSSVDETKKQSKKKNIVKRGINKIKRTIKKIKK